MNESAVARADPPANEKYPLASEQLREYRYRRRSPDHAGLFYFSKPHTGALGKVAKIGIWFIMIGFGAHFGYMVMARVSLLIGRIQFLFVDWLHWTT